MSNTGHKSVMRWFLAITLLMLGLSLSGTACAKTTADQWPARVQARGVSAQQDLERRATQSASRLEQANGAMPLLALLLVIAFDARRAKRQAVAEVLAPREHSLWLMPFLFRPPPFLAS